MLSLYPADVVTYCIWQMSRYPADVVTYCIRQIFSLTVSGRYCHLLYPADVTYCIRQMSLTVSGRYCNLLYPADILSGRCHLLYPADVVTVSDRCRHLLYLADVATQCIWQMSLYLADVTYCIWQMSLTDVIPPRVLAVGQVDYFNTKSEPTNSNVCQIK
jgi:hypothetical protein